MHVRVASFSLQNRRFFARFSDERNTKRVWGACSPLTARFKRSDCSLCTDVPLPSKKSGRVSLPDFFLRGAGRLCPGVQIVA